jgi:lysophospholipase L1-like esterase
MNYIISLYISIWASFAYTYMDKLPKPVVNSSKEYSFVQYQKNKIFMPYTSTMFHFHQAMDQVIEGKKQKLSIVHIGDSHIQAGFLCDQMRIHFLDEPLLGNGGRGYLFPNSMAHAQNAYNLKVSYKGLWNGSTNIQNKSSSWGLSGIVATTSDSKAQFSIDPSSLASRKYPITKARVYHQVNNPNSYSVKVLMPDGTLITPYKISRDGYVEFDLPYPQTKVTFQLEKEFDNQTFFTLEGVVLDNDDKGSQYHSVGVNGAMVSSFLKHTKLEDHIRSLTPDLVIISLGTNDAYTSYFNKDQYKYNLARLVQRIKAGYPETSILITTPADCLLGGKSNTSNLYAIKAIQEIGQEADCAVWDLFTVMGGLGSVKKWQGANLSAYDGVHFSGSGYRLQADLLYNALVETYADYRIKR